MSGAVDESCQLLVVAIDINPNQLLFARQPGINTKAKLSSKQVAQLLFMSILSCWFLPATK